MITTKLYRRLKARFERHEKWRNGRTSYYAKEVPKNARISNDERSQLEVYEFVQNAPDKYFVYVRRNCIAPGLVDKKVEVTTWTGQVLGYGTLGKMYKCGASLRYPIRFVGINGVKYSGTYYHSSGDYARVKKVKS